MRYLAKGGELPHQRMLQTAKLPQGPASQAESALQRYGVRHLLIGYSPALIERNNTRRMAHHEIRHRSAQHPPHPNLKQTSTQPGATTYTMSTTPKHRGFPACPERTPMFALQETIAYSQPCSQTPLRMAPVNKRQFGHRATDTVFED